MKHSLLEMSQAYFEVYVCGIVLIFLYDGGRSVLMGCGDSKNPFYLVMISSLCNVILDYVMIGVFQMGTAGAALATVFSQGIGLVLVIILLYRKLADNKQKQPFYLDKGLLKALGKVAFPSMCQQLTLSLFAFILQIMINDLGVEIVTGYTAAAKVANIYMMAVIGFSQGFALMASRKIGENHQEEVIDLRKAAVKNFLIYYVVLVIVIMVGVRGLWALRCLFVWHTEFLLH